MSQIRKVSDEMRATLVDHVLHYAFSLRETGQRVQPIAGDADVARLK